MGSGVRMRNHNINIAYSHIIHHSIRRTDSLRSVMYAAASTRGPFGKRMRTTVFAPTTITAAGDGHHTGRGQRLRHTPHTQFNLAHLRARDPQLKLL